MPKTVKGMLSLVATTQIFQNWSMKYGLFVGRRKGLLKTKEFLLWGLNHNL